MSHITCSHPHQRLLSIGFIVIGLAASAATAQTQSSSPELERSTRIPPITRREGEVRAVDGEQALLSHGAFRPADEIARAREHSSNVESDLDNDVTTAYFAEFTGVGAEGRDMIWRGAVAGAAVGELTIRLAHVGRAVDTAKPTWPVEGIIFVSGEDPQRAFAAEVHGTIDWSSKRVKLAGGVSVGYMRDARIELMADLVNYDLSGELRLVPVSLAAVR